MPFLSMLYPFHLFFMVSVSLAGISLSIILINIKIVII